jgi:hypothetical protein
MAVSLAEKSARTDDPVMVGGFAESNKYSMTADTNCSIRGVLPNGLFLHDCAVMKGDSGAPIMIKNKEMIEILGIQVAEATLGATVQIAVPVPTWSQSRDDRTDSRHWQRRVGLAQANLLTRHYDDANADSAHRQHGTDNLLLGRHVSVGALSVVAKSRRQDKLEVGAAGGHILQNSRWVRIAMHQINACLPPTLGLSTGRNEWIGFRARMRILIEAQS